MNEIVKIQPQPPAMTFGELERVANAIAGSNMFGCRDPNAVLTLCLLAQAEGQHPAVVFRDYSIIQGKPSKTAEAMLRDFIGSGGRVHWNRLDDECADATFSHPQGGEVTINWTIARANKAGLGSRDMWKKYPRQMLRSRVVSEGVRTICPSATSGLYVPEEVRDFDDVKEPAHHTITGEIVEEKSDQIEREKVPGITKIKGRLNKFMKDGNRCTDIEEFRAMVKANRDDIRAVRDANHEYWTGDDGDNEGFARWMERRYAELTPKEESLSYQFLASCIEGARSKTEIDDLRAKHSEAIEMLTDNERNEFEEICEAKSEGLKNITPLEAGAFGG